MTIVKPEQSIINEIEAERPSIPVGLLSRTQKDLLIERGMVGLYRWYINRSQETRSWNPDLSFDWRAFRTDHSATVNRLLEGFFAVEQYVPDYVSTLLQVVRRSHGRSHFHIRWGSEEEKHADAWYNTVLFSKARTPKWVADYLVTLRQGEWKLPWADPMRMVFYTVIQERATQVNYLKTAIIARGQNPLLPDDADPILAQVAQTIAIDEAAHYNFFLEGARLYLYYYPAQALEALRDVIQHFAMPANHIIPDFDTFAEATYRAGVYGPREYTKDVLQVALKNLTVTSRKALFTGVQASRQVPDTDGNMIDTALFEQIDYEVVKKAVQKIFERVGTYETKVGFDALDPTLFIPSGIMATS